jgi:hypothetical protein
VGWHDLTINLAATIQSPASLTVTLTDGVMWVDDVIVNGAEYDLGTALFAGGTEISTVIDITDTAKSVHLIGLIPGSDVVILATGTNTVLASVDQEPTASWLFSSTSPVTIDIGIIKPGYVTQYIYGYVVDQKGGSLPITQIADRSYV